MQRAIEYPNDRRNGRHPTCRYPEPKIKLLQPSHLAHLEEGVDICRMRYSLAKGKDADPTWWWLLCSPEGIWPTRPPLDKSAFVLNSDSLPIHREKRLGLRRSAT
jgi:hypothetical protein